MNHEPDSLYGTIHDLTTRALDGTATPAERERLERLVGGSTEARRIFVEYMEETALLKWQLGGASSELLHDLGGAPGPRGAALVGRRPGPGLVRVGLGIAAAIGIVATSLVLRGQRIVPIEPAAPAVREARERRRVPAAEQVKAGVATLTRATAVAWHDGGERADLSRLERGDVLRFARGEVELVFDSGVEVRVRGPADFEVRAADYAVSRLGAVSARVGEDGRGFTIETPTARVMDLGTEFGVDVSRSGATEVAVFRGLVDLAVRREPDDTPRRLKQGEALRVDPDGSLARVTTISSDRFPLSTAPPRAAAPAPVIDAVEDNAGDSGSRKFYRIVRSGLWEESQAFVDRNHQWNGTTPDGMPEFLRGVEYVMPYNDDKFAGHLAVKLVLARPATVYVFYSDSLPVPAWLERDFVDTGRDIGLDEARNRYLPARQTAVGPGLSIDTVFSVWRRDVPGPMTVTLGAVEVPENRAGYNMYGIAAAPLADADDADRDASGREP